MATTNLYTTAYTIYSATPGAGDWLIDCRLSAINTGVGFLTWTATVNSITVGGAEETRTKDAGQTTAQAIIPIHCAAAEAVVITVKSGNSSDTAVDVATLTSTIAMQQANVTQVSGTAQTAGDIIGAIGTIGSGTGAALNFEVIADNATTPIPLAPLTPVTKLGTQTGTFANTLANDASVHSIASEVSGTNKILWVYKFSVGAGRTGTKIVFRAAMGSTGDTVTLKAYNFLTNLWESRTTFTGTTSQLIDIPLLNGHTGTGANAGIVYLEIVFDEGDTGVININELYCTAQNHGSETYSDGAIWVGGTNTGTSQGLDGVPSNPVTWAAAQTLSAATGLTRFRIRNGFTVTLNAATTAKSLIGRHWNLVLGSQDITNSYIEGATVTGAGAAGTNHATFMDCEFGDGTANTVTVPPMTAYRCGVNCPSGNPLTATASAAAQYVFTDCFSLIAGSGTPYFTFAALTGASGVNFRRWSGGSNITTAAGAALTMEVVTGGGQSITLAEDGTAEVRGICRSVTLVLGGTGTVQIDTMTGPITISGTTTSTVNIYGVCSNVADTSTTATINNLAVISGSLKTAVGLVDTVAASKAPGSAGGISTYAGTDTSGTTSILATVNHVDYGNAKLVRSFAPSAALTVGVGGGVNISAATGWGGGPLPTVGTSTLTQTQVTGGAYDLTNSTYIAALKSGLGTIPASGNWNTVAPDNATIGAIATILSGITSLAKWLGLIAGKTADSATLAEINATTAGAGYVNTTDSLQAIADADVAAALTPQQVRDAMKLAPTSGAGAAGSIDLVLTTVATDVAGLDGAAMRGTDSAMLAASYVVSPTVGQIDTQLSGTHGSGAWDSTASLTGVAAAVWVYANRSLTSTGGAVGVDALESTKEISVHAFMNGTASMVARIRNWSGDDLVTSDVSAIVCSIYTTDATGQRRQAAVPNQESVAVTVSGVLFASLQSDDAYTDYNFKHEPDIHTNAAFPAAGFYQVEYIFTLNSGEPIVVRFKVHVV